MAFLLLTNISGAFSKPQHYEGVENKALNQTMVEKGDVVTVTYSSKEPDGEVFESKSIKFRVGMGTAYPGIEQAVIGMKKGEAKAIVVSGVEGYGEIDTKKIVKVPRHRSMPRHKQLALAAFKRSANAEPVEGKRYTLRGLQWPIKVLKVENGRVLLDLMPEKETRIPALLGYARVTYNEKSVTTTMITEAKVGDQLTMRNGQHAKVVALDDNNMTLDLNHPLAGRQVMFDFTIAELTKTPTIRIPDLEKWENIDGIGSNELKKKYRALLTFAKPHLVRTGIKKLVVPSGVPDIYGEELGVTYSSEKADEMIAILRKFEDEKLDKEQLDAYIRIGMRTSCEYCCRVKTLVRKDGERACGCAHSYAMRGLAKYLILNHDDMYSEDEILEEINRWKALFFPKQSIQKVIATSKGTGAFDLSVLQEMPNMVGGC
jgi:FKBP-type peptidyl-prolyl cis-trans isomerase 2